LYNVILDHLERSKTYFEPSIAFLLDQIHYTYSDIPVSSSQIQTASAASSSKSIGSKIYKKRRVMEAGCQVTRYCDLQKNDVGEDTDVLKVLI